MSNRPLVWVLSTIRSREMPDRIRLCHLFVIVLFLAAAVSSNAQNINNPQIFTDPAFRLYVEEYMGVAHDAPFTRFETEQKTEPFQCADRNIKSLKGIEYFPNITGLHCSSNGISELNISQNRELRILDGRANNLTSLNVSHLTKLEKLIVADNSLSELDLTQNTLLITLDCVENQLIRLDLSNNPQLVEVHCNSNRLTELDATHCLALTTLICFKNQLMEINLSNNNLLRILFCYENQLRTVNLPPRGALVTLLAQKNRLEDVSSWVNINHPLERIDLRYNDLECGDREAIEDLRTNHGLGEPEFNNGDLIAGLSGFTLSDANGDGIPDIVVVPFDGTIRMITYQNNRLTPVTIGNLGEYAKHEDVLIADIDLDGLQDLLVASYPKSGDTRFEQISVVCGEKPGEFKEEVTFSTTRPSTFFPLRLGAIDFNRDGLKDIFLLDIAPREAILFLNRSENATSIPDWRLW
ncbi:MAG: FG-GAP-like repeat-containing protein [bacterium]